MTKDLLKKIIVGGMLIGGLAGMIGCSAYEEEIKKENPELENGYFSDKGIICEIYSYKNGDGVAMSAADMDGDNDLDILFAKSSFPDTEVRYFENLGEGKYIDKGLICKFERYGDQDDIAMSVADMDGDGDKDILILKSNFDKSGVRYFENNIPQKNKK